ncbi:MAG: HAD family hydrolase [Sulfobacillus acidophilus]|uniref:HAD family hydrolase n=1 Tax=Sulfobacillus acidophilus TaxID=53633 RepID=A0A2T2WJI9_9FIRM|nr:MAG: HAD family hydrolase [Sulfobacillus acidophilus]
MWQLLFDLDGTILDTTELIMQSFIYAFANGLGQQVTREELMTHFGRPLQDQFGLMRPDLPQSEIDRLIAIYREHNESEHDRWVTLVPGADRVLRELASLGYPLGIVTSKRLDMTMQGLKLVGLDHLFSCIVHTGSTIYHKPRPEPIQHALRLLGAVPATAIYVGDSPYDMAAGRAASVRTLGLVHNTFSDRDLRSSGADDVVYGWPEVLQTLKQWTSACNPKPSVNQER